MCKESCAVHSLHPSSPQAGFLPNPSRLSLYKELFLNIHCLFHSDSQRSCSDP